jgi:hypothetical protein
VPMYVESATNTHTMVPRDRVDRLLRVIKERDVATVPDPPPTCLKHRTVLPGRPSDLSCLHSSTDYLTTFNLFRLGIGSSGALPFPHYRVIMGFRLLGKAGGWTLWRLPAIRS